MTDGDKLFNLIGVEKALDFLINMYVPVRRDEIKMAFWGSENMDFQTIHHSIYFTFNSSVQKDERLILIEEKIEGP